LLALCAFPSLTWGIAPAFISDEELARYPIIVVAKWDKGPFRPHHRSARDSTHGEVITAIESFTELNILRVIKGPVQPGLTTLKVGWGVSWSTNGDRVTSGTSTELPGDVDRIRTINYSRGGSAECNPDHPSNNGAGKRLR